MGTEDETVNAVVPMKPRDDALSLRSPPHNFEAEVQLLGAILANNKAYDKIADFLRPDHFTDPRHARIFDAVAKLISRGQLASAVTLKNFFEQDATLTEIGGPTYLGKLAAAAVTIINIAEHGRIVHDLYLRRQLIGIGEDIVNRAYAHDLETAALDQIHQAEGELLKLATDDSASGVVSARQVREAIVGELREPLPCVSTGFPRLDAILGGGLTARKCYCMTGRKKSAKTLWGGSISANLNRARVRHGYIAAEMGPERIEQRNIAAEMGFNSLAFVDGKYRDDPRFAARVAETAIATPDDARFINARGLTFDRFKRDVLQLARIHKVKGVIVDYLQLIRGNLGREKTEAQHLLDVAQWMHDQAEALKIWFLVLAQMNQEGNVRGGEGVRLAFDLVVESKRDQGGKGTGIWLEMMDTRDTRWRDAGDEAHPAFLIDEKIGPRLIEQPDEQEAANIAREEAGRLM